MKKLLITFFALLGVIQSAAADNYDATQSWSVFGRNTWLPTPAQACSAMSNTNVSATVVTNDPSGYYKCNYHYASNNTDSLTNFEVPRTTCPYGGSVTIAPAGSSAGKVVNTYTCVGGTPPPPPPPPPPACAATDNVPPLNITIGFATGKDVGSAATYLYKANTDTDFSKAKFCVNGCLQAVRTTDGVQGYQEQTASANGYFRIFAQGVGMSQTGGTCQITGTTPDILQTQSVPGTPNTFNGACPTGTVPGGQSPDGMTICVGTATQPASTSSTSTTTPKTTTTDASGNTVDTVATTTTNGDGSKTTVTTTTTTAPDGTKSVSVASNTTAATSGAPGTTDKPQEQKDMCALHPELTVCHNSQVMGACALVTCTGDAIQCATLRAAATIQCKQQSDSDAISKLAVTATGTSILGGADPMQGGIDAMKTGTQVDLSNPNLDQSGFLGSGACLAPITMNVRGRTFSYSFDTVCANIQPIRAIVMLLAFISAYLIVSRSVLQS